MKFRHKQDSQIVDAFVWNPPTQGSAPQWFHDAVKSGSCLVEFDDSVSLDFPSNPAKPGDVIANVGGQIVSYTRATFLANFVKVTE